MSQVCRVPIPISELLCCLDSVVCKGESSQLTLQDIADGPGLTAWEDAQACGGNPPAGTYNAGETALLTVLQEHLQDAWREMYDQDPAHSWRGSCCFRIFPCTPCGFCGRCSDCKESEVVPLTVGLCGTIEWDRVRSAEMVIGSVAEPVQVGWDGSAPSATPPRWRLELWPRPRLLRQAVDGQTLPDIPTQELDQPPGSDDTWHLRVCVESDPPKWYVAAVADLACVRYERCLPKSRCAIGDEIETISNDGETVTFRTVDLDDLINGATGTRVLSIDAAVQRLKDHHARRGGMEDPAERRPVIRVDVANPEDCCCCGCCCVAAAAPVTAVGPAGSAEIQVPGVSGAVPVDFQLDPNPDPDWAQSVVDCLNAGGFAQLNLDMTGDGFGIVDLWVSINTGGTATVDVSNRLIVTGFNAAAEAAAISCATDDADPIVAGLLAADALFDGIKIAGNLAFIDVPPTLTCWTVSTTTCP